MLQPPFNQDEHWSHPELGITSKNVVHNILNGKKLSCGAQPVVMLSGLHRLLSLWLLFITQLVELLILWCYSPEFYK
jgi:hypothetical protein